MIDRGILFTVFDKQKGLSVPIFHSRELSQGEADQISRRSQMTLSMMNTAELETAEAILPFSALKKLGFILLFQIRHVNPAEPKCIAALSYLVPQEQQVFLYSKVPFLKFKAEELASKIKQNYVYTGTLEFPKELSNALSSWRVTERETTAEIQIIERKVTLSEKQEGGSIEFFLSQVRKNEDKALGALFRGHPVFVTGGSDIIVDLVVHSLDMFAPHLSLRKVGYSTSLVDPSYADIIGISKTLIKNYPKEVLIDVDKKQVKNGITCLYSKQLIKDLRKNPDQSAKIIRESTEKLLEVTGLLVDAFSYPEEEREDRIKEIRNEYDSSVIEVAAEIGAQRNPLIGELLLRQVSARFLDWMGDL